MTRPSTNRRSFPAVPASAGEARRFVEAVLRRAGHEHEAYPATMLVSELVANAILHTGTPLEVVVDLDDRRARIEVHDGSRQLPIRKNYSALSGTGRGMLMVDRMSSDWGADVTATGKMVWFELGFEPAAGQGAREVDAR